MSQFNRGDIVSAIEECTGWFGVGDLLIVVGDWPTALGGGGVKVYPVDRFHKNYDSAGWNFYSRRFERTGESIEMEGE